MTRIVLWRHGQTDWNTINRFQGHSDIPLNSVGIFQAEHAARELAALKPTRIISSDLLRTQQTAAALSAITGIDVALDPRLRETYGGHWEGRTGEENRELDGENFSRWLTGGDIPAGTIGESRSQVASRAMTAIGDALSSGRESDETVIFVTHGGTSRCILGHILDLPVEKWGILGGLSNASWSILDQHQRHISGTWFLVEHNAGTIPEPQMGDFITDVNA
jgi:probable phosphoglycerate mutase